LHKIYFHLTIHKRYKVNSAAFQTVDEPGGSAAFEVKLGARDEILDKAAANLVNFSKRIDTSKSTPPASLNTITGLGAYAYQRKNRVNVAPIGTLDP
jgi:hypothetical protein